MFKIIGAVDIRSIKRWSQALEGTSDWTRLVPAWTCKRQEPFLTAEEKETFRHCYITPSHPSIGGATKLAKTILGVASPSSERTFRRWAEWLLAKEGPGITFIRYGEKAAREKYAISIRRKPADAVGDVFIADGHRLNFQVLHPFTGKPCRATIVGYLDHRSFNLAGFEVMVEEDTQCIASALRDAIIYQGKTPRVARQDNGIAFRGRFFTGTQSLEESGIKGLFENLHIISTFTGPYNAQAKLIERFWKEFTDKFERLLPSFTGSSVEDKPPWMRMGEKWHRKAHNGDILTIKEACGRIRTWRREYWEKQPCPRVKGKTIGEVFHEGKGPGIDNVAELDELMFGSEVRTIRANGVTLFGGEYYDEQLFGLSGQKAIIRYSLSNLDYVRVFLDGHFICTAKRFDPVHGAAAQLGDAKDVAEVKHWLKIQKGQRKMLQKLGIKSLATGRDEPPPWDKLIDASPTPAGNPTPAVLPPDVPF
ncbi:MAG: Mu transposase C-terminal domain-containing protein, partial [Syntrophorhabdales bacterium]